jgi:hypothetical protein
LSYWASGGLRAGLTGRCACHYARREPGILDIFSKYSLKVPRICSNILYISLSGRHRGLPGKADMRAVQAGGRTDNLDISWGSQQMDWQSVRLNGVRADGALHRVVSMRTKLHVHADRWCPHEWVVPPRMELCVRPDGILNPCGRVLPFVGKTAFTG